MTRRRLALSVAMLIVIIAIGVARIDSQDLSSVEVTAKAAAVRGAVPVLTIEGADLPTPN